MQKTYGIFTYIYPLNYPNVDNIHHTFFGIWDWIFFWQPLMLTNLPFAVVVLGCGLNGYLNTEPNKLVFGALGIRKNIHVESLFY